jgi:hypothetical protein
MTKPLHKKRERHRTRRHASNSSKGKPSLNHINQRLLKKRLQPFRSNLSDNGTEGLCDLQSDIKTREWGKLVNRITFELAHEGKDITSIGNSEDENMYAPVPMLSSNGRTLQVCADTAEHVPELPTIKKDSQHMEQLEYIRSLIAIYNEDIAAMSRDIKHNYYQYTEGQLRRLYTKFQSYLRMGSDMSA